jgi:hypothetical protein
MSEQCKAHSKQTGKQCGRKAIPGGTVCRYHGGAAPQVIAKAEERLKALVDPAIDALADIINDPDPQARATRLAAARDLLDRTGYGATQKHEVTGTIDEEAKEVLQAIKELKGEQ